MQEVFDAFAAVMRLLPPEPEIREAFIFATWKRVAGELLCEHAAAVKVDKDVLHVAVANLAWRKHLADLSGQMVFKLNAMLGGGAVRRIEFVINEENVLAHRGEAGTSGADREFIALAESETEGDLNRSAQGIEDETLRHVFLLAAGRCLARRRLHSQADRH